jgi:hypothetical protein
MHSKFVDRWCETYDRLYDELGEEAALAMTRDVLEEVDWGLVKDRFPQYLKEKRQNVNRHTD